MNNEEELETIESVGVDITINDVRYVGIAKVDTETEEVDLSAFSEEELGRCVYYHGNYLCKVHDVLRGEALYKLDLLDDIGCCATSDYWVDNDLLVWCRDDEYRFEVLTEYWDGEYYDPDDGSVETIRRGYNEYDVEWRPDWYYEDLCWCDHCNCYVDGGDYEDDNCCRWCYEEYCEDDEDGDDDRIIDEYTHSHYSEVIYFGADEKDFVGLGFELEVDCSSDNQHNNGETASGLCNYCGLEDDEMRYAHDGSLDYGFEIISQPHTVRAFWDNADKWRKMLSYLSSRGYWSHDHGKCGLHVHVSRGMFGKSQSEQDRAISKVYAFFDENWDEIVKISRREYVGYCRKNELSDWDKADKTRTTYQKWKKISKFQSGHHVALNNGNNHTFEYRLGRGTLNAWSFFSWIDFVITITKNARRISVDKVTSNDLVSWLGGIKESTAKYIYKRGAFQKEMLVLYPNIEWETDLTDNNND